MMLSKIIPFSSMIILCAIFVHGQTPFSGTSGNFITDSKIPLVEVLFPIGGETIDYLEPFLVTWTATDDSFGPDAISIAISTEEGGSFTVIASNLPNTGSAMVTPPGILTSYAKIKVIGSDNFGLEENDESDNYFIINESFSGTSANFITDSKLPVIAVVSPNGGETIDYLETFTVTWIATDESFGSNPISIAISTEGGEPFTVVASNLPNTGSAMVIPPGEVSAHALIKVVGLDGFGVEGEDESDNYFVFEESFAGTSVNFTTDSKLPDITVVSPNGGEIYNHLEPLLVTWVAQDESFSTNPISIAISVGGGPYTVVVSNLPNTGSAMLTPPFEITNTAIIKVIGIDGFGLEEEDISDNYFILNECFSDISANFITDSKAPEISVLSPTGGDIHYFDNPLLVKWDATDNSFGPNPITISVSTDGGSSFTDVANGLPNTDSAFVITPQVITDHAIVKVSVVDGFGLTSYDENDDYFSLKGINVVLKAFLQGPFTGSEMHTDLNQGGFLPSVQPYNIPPWNYNGTEKTDPSQNNHMVDWVLIEIREAPDVNSATETTVIARRAGLILEDGTISDIYEEDFLQFGIEVTDNLFAVVYHRNHLPIMSAYPLNQAYDVYYYDYTTGQDKVYGGVLACSNLDSGTWGMTSSDGNANGKIDNIDKNDVWLPERYSSGYWSGDFDMDGFVSENDKQTLWQENAGKSRMLP